MLFSIQVLVYYLVCGLPVWLLSWVGVIFQNGTKRGKQVSLSLCALLSIEEWVLVAFCLYRYMLREEQNI